MGRHLWLPGGAGPARDEPGGPARPALWQRRQVAADKEQRRWVFYSDAAFLKRGVTELWWLGGGLKGVPLQMRPDQASGSSLPHVWPLVF